MIWLNQWLIHLHIASGLNPSTLLGQENISWKEAASIGTVPRVTEDPLMSRLKVRISFLLSLRCRLLNSLVACRTFILHRNDLLWPKTFALIATEQTPSTDKDSDRWSKRGGSKWTLMRVSVCIASSPHSCYTSSWWPGPGAPEIHCSSRFRSSLSWLRPILFCSCQ